MRNINTISIQNFVFHYLSLYKHPLANGSLFIASALYLITSSLLMTSFIYPEPRWQNHSRLLYVPTSMSVPATLQTLSLDILIQRSCSLSNVNVFILINMLTSYKCENEIQQARKWNLVFKNTFRINYTNTGCK